MPDLMLAWLLVTLTGIALLALVIVACRQVLKRYRGQPLVKVLWIAVIVLCPFGGVAIWLVWETWARDAVSRHLSNSAMQEQSV